MYIYVSYIYRIYIIHIYIYDIYISSKTLCTYLLTLIINFQKETKTNISQ